MWKAIHFLLVFALIFSTGFAVVNVRPMDDVDDELAQEAMTLCKEFMPAGYEDLLGFICLKQYPQKYLECNGVTAAYIRNCAKGTMCSNPTDKWSEDNPCELRYTSDVYGSNTYGSNSYGSDSYGSDSYGSDSYGSDVFGSDSYGSDSYGSDSYGSDSYGSDSYGSEFISDSEGLFSSSESESKVTSSESGSKVSSSESESIITSSESGSKISSSESESKVTSSESESKVTSSESESKVTSSESGSKVSSSESESKVTSSESGSKASSSESGSIITSSESESKVTSSESESKVTSSESGSKVTSSESESKVTSSESESKVTSSESGSKASSSESGSIITSSESESKVTSSESGSKVSSSESESKVTSSESESKISSSSKSESSSSPDPTVLCRMYMPEGTMSAGFVCIEKDSPKYLECSEEGIADIRSCAEGVVCASPVGVWNSENPCGWEVSSNSTPSSSSVSTPSSSSSDVLKGLCREYSGESDNAGFVCLNENAAEYLRCYEDHDISLMLPCPMGTRCTADVGTWTEDPPCSAGTEGNLPNTTNELCMQYVGSIYDFGYVCIEPNATNYLRCFLAQGVSVMMDCAPGTKCTATPGTLTTAAPCGW